MDSFYLFLFLSCLIMKSVISITHMLQFYYSIEINNSSVTFPSGEMIYEIMKTAANKYGSDLVYSFFFNKKI